MSKTRQKEKSEIELLRGKVRKLESTCRRLRKENNALKKRMHFTENVIDEVAEDIEPKAETCQNCGKGELAVVDLVHVLIESCNLCEYRKRIKPKR